MAKKEKAPKELRGFFIDDAFQPMTGKICSIKYFVFSLASVFCPLLLLFGRGNATQARAYMTETGDTEGIEFLAASKALRFIAKIPLVILVIIFIVGVVIGLLS